MAKSKARDITEKTIKRLYALSGNQCAFPSCTVSLLNSDNDTNLSNICHIEAAEVGGQRYNKDSNDEYRRSFENLVLLCANHHLETNDVDKYPTAVLQGIKRNHETKIVTLISGSKILLNNPSALNSVIAFIGKNLFENPLTSDTINPPNTEQKISYNNVVRYKPIIEQYAVYQGKLIKIYKEIADQGLQKKEILLQNIKTIYLKEKVKYATFEEVRLNADAIIQKVENELWSKIENSTNFNTSLTIEEIEICLLVILVDAFICCNILEEPPRYDN